MEKHHRIPHYWAPGSLAFVFIQELISPSLRKIYWIIFHRKKAQISRRNLTNGSEIGVADGG